MFDRLSRVFGLSKASTTTRQGSRDSDVVAKSTQHPSRRKSTARKSSRRHLAIETVERRRLMATDLGSITGAALVDVNNNGVDPADIPVLIDVTDTTAPFTFVRPGDANAIGVTIQLFDDTGGTPGVFDAPGSANPDVLIQTAITDVNTGQYRFDRLIEGTYFVRQLETPLEQTDPNGVALSPPDIFIPPTPGNPVTVQITAAQASGDTEVTIDQFDDQTAASFNATAGNTVVQTQTLAGSILGTERNVEITAVGAQLDFSFNPPPAQVTINAGFGGTGSALLQYDGVDGAITRDHTNLNVDLRGTADDDDFAALVFTGAAQVAGESADILIYSGENDFSIAENIAIPASATLEEFIVSLDDFTIAAGTGADFSNVTAIEVLVDITQPANDIALALVESVSSDSAVANFLNIQPLTLGGLIFEDISAGAGNNGLRDTGEASFDDAPVQVELYIDEANFDPATATLVGTTTTDGNGRYQFDDLLPGDYRVVIPSSQFAAAAAGNPAGPLFGFRSSLVDTDPAVDADAAAPDPDNDVTGDDNGTEFSPTGPFVTEPVTLISQDEPTDDPEVDSNLDDLANITVDFGVVPTVDLQITKTLDANNSTITPGGNAVFNIVIQNNGPIDATGVIVTDTLPAGLTFDAANSTAGAIVNGQTITFDVGNLPVVDIGGGVTPLEFTIATTIGAAQTTDLTNPANIATSEQFDTDATNNDDTADVDFLSTDLAISKSATLIDGTIIDPTTTPPETIAAGTQFVYELTVTNNGPDDATGVFVTDTLPDGVTLAATGSNVVLPGDPAGTDRSNLIIQDPNFPNDPQALLINIGALANTEVATITLVVDSVVDAPDALTNAARVSVDPDTDPNDVNDTSTVVTNFRRDVDLAITKTSTGGSTAGDTGTFEITVVNNGPGTARGVTVADVLPTGLDFVVGSLTTTDGVTVEADPTDADDLTFTLPDVAPGAAAAITFSFDVDIASTATADILNTAAVDTTDNDLVVGNNTDSATISPGQSFELDITKDVVITEGGNVLTVATPGDAAETVTYTITVTNDAASPSVSPAFTVTDVIDGELTGVAINSPSTAAADENFNAATNTVTVNFDPLAPGESVSFTLTTVVTADAVGDANSQIDNVAVVTPLTNAAGEIDPNDNSDNAPIALSPDFDIVVTKALGAAEPDAIVAPGDTVTFDLTVSNSGPSDATDIVLTDTIPAGLTFVSGTLGGVAATAGVFPAFDLDSGASLSGTVTFTVDADATGTITNTASVPDDTDPRDDTAGNDSDTAIVTVAAVADVTITKTVDSTTAQIGDTLTYTVTATNNGPSPADAVTIFDDLPTDVTFVSGTGPGGAVLTADTAGDVTFNGGTLASGASFTITILATVDADATTTLVNNATVSTTTDEGANAATNAASASTSLDLATASLAGSVYVDANGNGIRDAGEVGIAGVTLTLTGTDITGTAVNQTATTDINGDYLFDNLVPGTYSVSEAQPAGFGDGDEAVGTGATGAVASDDVFTEIGLGDSADAVDFDFGEIPVAVTMTKRRFLASSTS